MNPVQLNHDFNGTSATSLKPSTVFTAKPVNAHDEDRFFHYTPQPAPANYEAIGGGAPGLITVGF